MRKHAKHTQQRIDIKIHVLLGSLKNMKKNVKSTCTGNTSKTENGHSG
jgi:uncharacterized protein YukE